VRSEKLDVSAEFSRAVKYHQAGQLGAAEGIYRKILAANPRHTDALHLLGVVAHQAGQNDRAVNLIRQAIEMNPGDPNYHNNLGAAFRDQGKLDQAISAYQKSLELNPGYAEAHNNMGNAFRDQGKLKEAVSAYQNAIRLRPNLFKAYDNMGISLKEQGKLDEAISCYQKLVQLKPDHALAYEKMGNAFRDQGKLGKADACYEKSLGLQPNPGIEVRKALMIPPINESRAQIEDSRKRVLKAFETLKAKGLRISDPHHEVGTPNFYFAYHGMNDRELNQYIADFHIRACPELETANQKLENRRAEGRHPIRIGFISLHLCHPTQQTVGHLTHGIIRHLSREKFHVTLFRFSGAKNARTKRFDAMADQVVVLPNKLGPARKSIAEQELDILFYPDIGMDSLTYFLAFSRLARVQCVTWGHPVTTGIPNMDYFISSESLESPGAEKHYSEQLVRLKRLPVYYQRPKPPKRILSRKNFGLPEDRNLYVCPQALFKFHPDFDAPLGAMLRRDPKGLLVFLEGSYPHFTQLIWNRFRSAFPDLVDRVRFIAFMPHQAFLSLLLLADVLIDPPYFGGGNTTYESFACGLPIVTWPGPFMRGRVTLACYQQMGVTDCVAQDAQSYTDIAFRLANDKAWREEIRGKIRANAHKLFDDREAVRELEQFFERALGTVSQTQRPTSAAEFDIKAELKKAIQLHQSGQARQAELIYQKILEIRPDHSDALHLSGVLAHQSDRKEEAVKLIRQAIQMNPQKSHYYNSLGITFQDQGKTNEAISCYHKALELRPNFTEAYGNIGFALLDQGRTDEAIAYYQKALKFSPNDAVIHNDMGTAFQEQGKVDEAVACFQKAIRLKPNYPEAYNNLGNAFKDQSRLDESVSAYKKALELRPDYTKAYSYLVRQLQQTCAWSEIEELSPRLDELTKHELEQGKKTSESPFMNLTRCTDLARNLAVAKSWADDAAKPMRNLDIRFSFEERRRKAASGQKIRVGYLSCDFRNHAVSHLMLGLFGLHCRDKFEVFCYSYGKDDGSEYRKRIQRDSDKFVDIESLCHADAAQRIYDDGVDILVELAGHTKGGKLGICALRPAPVQAIYLGYPGTSGADFFDYIITDSIVTPEDHAPYYTENFVCMPHCFQINDRKQPISDKTWKPSDFGLPEDAFVFCSFNHGYKIEPVMFDVWMRILRQVPKGILWLPKKSDTGVRNLRLEAEARGVAPERLFFVDRLPTKAEYLARLRLADLMLDTRVYNGHTTTSDALWAGVPLITLQGNHYASRVASSVLTAVGLPELVTYQLEDYEKLAVRLAKHADELRAVRGKLTQNRLTQPLFDTSRFTKDLETAYKEMWRISLAGEPPRRIEVGTLI